MTLRYLSGSLYRGQRVGLGVFLVMTHEKYDKVTAEGFRKALAWVGALFGTTDKRSGKTVDSEPPPSPLSGIDASDIPPRETRTKAEKP